MTRKAVVDLPAPAPAAPWGRVIAPSGVNVRSGPGTNFPVVGGARYGDEGEIVGRSADGGWWAVSAPALPGGVGWVSADFVLATNADDVPVIEVAPPVVVVPTAPPPATPTPVPAATATPAAQIAFSADPTTIDQGQCATLTWNVQNVQAVWIYPQGADFTRFPRAGQGSEVVCPPATTTYEMRVLRRDGGTELRQVTVTVRPSAEPQISFWADRTDLNQGECTWLRWDVQNVQGVWVYPQGADFNRYPRVGQDSERVCPDRTTTYEMRVQLRDGSVVLRQVTVNVAPPATATPIANPLAGTRWDVVQFNNGVALGTLLAGTSIRIEFGANGQITGNAGCNGFNGPYRVNGSQISIGPLGASMASCAEPEGIMQQEAEFLAALQTATAFRQDGSMLELQNAGGQIVVIANRAP
jgi:heat shock protein HslJ